MSIINHIYDKLNEWKSKQVSWDSPKRIILGHKSYEHLLNETKNSMVYSYKMMPADKAYYGEFCGMKISLSKRPNYVRILSEKMKYRTIKKGIYKNYSHPSIALAHWNKP